MVFFIIQTANGVDIEVVVIGCMVSTVFGLQKCGIVMSSTWFVLAGKITHQLTTESHKVTG